METGVVMWFDARKGFGYIQPDEGGQHVFVHRSVIQTESNTTLDEGQPVEYEVEDGPAGPKAIAVTPK